MEDQKVENNNGKKRTQISINGGGGGGGIIGGLLVLGGALAVTGLIAVTSFATKKNKAKNGGLQKPESESQKELDNGGSKKEDKTAQRLESLLQNSSANDETACCTTFETSKMLVSRPALILEEKLDLKANVDEGIPSCFAQEIVICDDAPPGSATSSDQHGVGIEECLSDNPHFGKQELDKSETETCLDDIEITEGETEDATSKTEGDTNEEEETEDNMNGDEDKDEDEEDPESDNVYENGEENSSEEKVRSSLDSNEEPIWPAELIEQKQLPLKEPLLNFQIAPKDIDEAAEEIAHTEDSANFNDGNISDSAGGDRTVTQETLMEKVVLFVLQKNQLSQFSPFKLTIWIIPMLMLTLLLAQFSPFKLTIWIIPVLMLTLLLVLVLLTHRSLESYHVLDPGSSAVTP